MWNAAATNAIVDELTVWGLATELAAHWHTYGWRMYADQFERIAFAAACEAVWHVQHGAA